MNDQSNLIEKSALHLDSRISGMFRVFRQGPVNRLEAVNTSSRVKVTDRDRPTALFRPFHASNFFRPCRTVDLEPGYINFLTHSLADLD